MSDNKKIELNEKEINKANTAEANTAEANTAEASTVEANTSKTNTKEKSRKQPPKVITERASKIRTLVKKRNVVDRIKRRVPIFLAVTNVVIIVVLVGQIVMTNYNLRLLNNQLSYMQDTDDTMQAQIENMQKSFKKTIKEESSLISEYEIEPVDVDFANNQYTLHVSVTPKEYTSSTDAIVYFGTNEYKLDYTNNVFEKNITLNVADDYDGRVSFLFQNGYKKSTEVIDNYSGFLNIFDSALSGKLKKSPSYSNGTLEFEGECSYALDGKKKYKFSTFEMCVDVDNVQTIHIDMLKTYLDEKEKLENTEKKSITDKLSDALSDGDSKDDNSVIENGKNVENLDGAESSTEATDNQGESLDEASAEDSQKVSEKDGTDKSDESTSKKKNKTVSTISGKVNLEDLIKNQIHVDGDKTVRVYLRAKTTEGYVFTYDLFNGIIDTENNGWKTNGNPFKVHYEAQDLKGGVLKIKN
ncbi:hypothetical protein SAMN04487761_11641 [Lachnospiraceae bacterium C7]|nr:hypothetical protein SAMN04487761_11641 [Lachnospiraceae bacterium C7]